VEEGRGKRGENRGAGGVRMWGGWRRGGGVGGSKGGGGRGGEGGKGGGLGAGGGGRGESKVEWVDNFPVRESPS